MPYGPEIDFDDGLPSIHAPIGGAGDANELQEKLSDKQSDTLKSRYQQASMPKVHHSPAVSQPANLSKTPETSRPSTATSRVAVVLGTSPARHGYLKQSAAELSEEELQVVTSDLDPLYQEERRATMTTPTGQTTAEPPHTVAGSVATTDPTTPQPPGTQPRRRGRPVGWRAGMGPYSSNAEWPGGPSGRSKPKPAGEPKRRGKPGRPAKQRSPGPRAIYNKLKPKFIAFLCEWEGCQAELQNFETLRRHILIVHGRSEACRWAACAANAHAPKLSTQDEFEEHIDDAHLESFLWHVGEGPRNDAEARAEAFARFTAGDDAFLPGYLFDKDGNQVVPSIRGQLVETEEERRERRRKLHRLMAARDRNAPEEEELTPAELAEMDKLLGAKLKN